MASPAFKSLAHAEIFNQRTFFSKQSKQAQSFAFLDRDLFFSK